MTETRSRFHSLEEFLTANLAHIDAVLDDGWGEHFPVKGREIEATVLFADISGFSGRTVDLTPAETLIYVNNFFAWIAAEALHGRPGIVDKYIGDEVMVVYSKEFGSEDPFADAVAAATAMSRHDVHAYRPHVGIASGRVIVGYVGTPLRYSASVFGAPVALAARCAAVKPAEREDGGWVASSWVTFPAAEMKGRELHQLIIEDDPPRFELADSRDVEFKNLGTHRVRQILNTGFWGPTQSAEDRAKTNLRFLAAHNRYWPAIG